MSTPLKAVSNSAKQEETRVRRKMPWWVMLGRDKFATAAVLWLLLLFVSMIIGPAILGTDAVRVDLSARNAPPGFSRGWQYIIGADSLGRPMISRLLVGARTTMVIAVCSVALAVVVGAFLGMIAGYRGGWIGSLIMRFADVVSSFPSLLLALIVLYILEPVPQNLIFVLAITRISVYLRVTRAEVLEIRERVFVDAARALGSSHAHILRWHIAPLVIPTLVTIVTVDFAAVMLIESALSFLGIGVQPPAITWGLMVAQGKNYLATAWWLSFIPGFVIMFTALSANLISNWLRTLTDPAQRWRLERASDIEDQT